MNIPLHILVAEDDLHIRTGLVDTLESEGYQVSEASDGAEAIELIDEKAFDLLLLDVMMPEKSGYDVCRHIRKTDESLPIIMLTAKGEEIDKVVGLQLGADDYMTKPFGIHELLARIEAVFRRCRRAMPSANSEPELTGTSKDACDKAFPNSNSDRVGKQISGKFPFADLTVDPLQFKLIRQTDGEPLDLTQREIQLLTLFRHHPNEVLSRERLLNEIWGIDYYGTTRTLDQHISMLRKKVEKNPATPQIITTVHGVGYRYNQ